MTRLMLHGRSPSSILLNRLQQARRRRQVTILLLSGWNFDQPQHKTQQNNNDNDEELFVELQSYIFESRLDEIILHNCYGTDQLQMLIATTLQSDTTRLTIRYDKQQSKIPPTIVNGFLQSAAFSLGAKRLRSLSFRGMQLSLENVRALAIALREFPWLESLSFKCNFLMHELERLPDLSLLENGRPQVAMKELLGVIQNLPMLESLELENCHLRDQDMAQLFYVLQNGSSPRIRALKLRGNQCQTQSMESLSHWLSKPTCELSLLDLSWQHHHYQEPPGTTRNTFDNQKKNHFNILLGFPFLAEGLACNQSLRTLSLSQNRMRSEYMAVLSRALCRNTTLRKLVMKDCRISLTGLALLAQNLQTFHLHSLNMNGDQRLPSRKVKDMLFRPMTRNVHLQDLILPDEVWAGDDDCPYNVSSSLKYLLEWNKAGRKVLLDPKFPDQMWPDLLARADRVGRHEQRDDRRAARHGASAIYYLLREKGPELLARENGSVATN